MACPWSETALAFRTIKFTSNHYWILYSFFLHRNSVFSCWELWVCLHCKKREMLPGGLLCRISYRNIFVCWGRWGEEKHFHSLYSLCLRYLWWHGWEQNWDFVFWEDQPSSSSPDIWASLNSHPWSQNCFHLSFYFLLQFAVTCSSY